MKIDLSAVQKAVDATSEDVMAVAGMILEADLKKKVSVPPPRSGNEYERQGGKKMHVASAPGEPPAVDTGRLRASISFDVAGNKRSVKIGATDGTTRNGGLYSRYRYTDPHGRDLELSNVIVAGSPVEYSADLEFGTTKVKPRPFLRPVFMQYDNNQKMVNMISNHLRKIGKTNG